MKGSLCMVSFVFAGGLCYADLPPEPDREGYCLDGHAGPHWEHVLHTSPHDDALVALFALRQGLCQLVEAGKLDLDRALRIFQRAALAGSLKVSRATLAD